MKTKPGIVLASLFWLTCICAIAQSDKEAIKAVIEKETTAFFGVDRKNWEVNWLDASYTFWAYSDSTAGSVVEGTENIKRNFDEYFRTAKPSKSKIDRVWLEIRVYGSGAYARFIQKVTDEIDRDETAEVRVLEKGKDGKWKIVCLNAIAKYPPR
jgi:ketosteroid isomerase-like protein